jgi:hypothetical protein
VGVISSPGWLAARQHGVVLLAISANNRKSRRLAVHGAYLERDRFIGLTWLEETT